MGTKVGDRSNRRGREFLTIPAAARALEISEKVLRREARAGSFPIYTFGGKRRRVRLVDIIEWVHSTLVVPPTAKAAAHAETVVYARLAREENSGTLRNQRNCAIPHRQDYPK